MVAIGNEHLDSVCKYVSARKHRDTTAILDLVADDIEVYSQRDGTYNGKKDFVAYLQKTKVEGTWEDPVVDPDQGIVVVRGVVKILFLPISVKSEFRFTNNGLIRSIRTGKA